jgi:hypothetical protein
MMSQALFMGVSKNISKEALPVGTGTGTAGKDKFMLLKRKRIHNKLEVIPF